MTDCEPEPGPAPRGLTRGKLCAYRVLCWNPSKKEQRRETSLEDAEVTRLLGGPPRLTREEIVGHPRLAEARQVYLDRFLEVYSGDTFLVRLLIETGRFFVFHM